MFAIQHHDLQPDLLCLANPSRRRAHGRDIIGEKLGTLPGTFTARPLAATHSRARIAGSIAEMKRLDLPRARKRTARISKSACRTLRATRLSSARCAGWACWWRRVEKEIRALLAFDGARRDGASAG